MSYILDALRRAQAERERGQVPGLEARTLVATPPPPAPPRAKAWWLGAAMALGAAGVVAVLVLRGAGAPTLAPAVPQAAAPALPLAAPAALPPTPMVVVSAPAVPPPTAAPPKPAVPTPIETPVSPALTALTAPAPTPAASAVRNVQWAQLSAELRRELPALALGGAIWSDNAASRFVIVNGQVLREGETAAPGVVLERIGPKAVFLRWRDWRIELPVQ